MIACLLGVVGILGIICLSEILWRTKILGAEGSRKLTHIFVGTFVAFWPFFTTFRNVQLLAVAFFGVIVLSRILHIFKGIHSVKRKGIGEIFYPVGIGAVSLLISNKYVFAAAILHLSLADGFAAIVGLKYGKKHRYHIGSLTKSYAGTLTFMAVSFLIVSLMLVRTTSPRPNDLALLFVIPLVTAFVENIAPYGSDNLLVPISVLGLVSLVNIF